MHTNSGPRARALRLLVPVLLLAALVRGGVSGAYAQDTGWTIERFHAEIAIQPDASIVVA